MFKVLFILLTKSEYLLVTLSNVAHGKRHYLVQSLEINLPMKKWSDTVRIIQTDFHHPSHTS